MNGVERSDDFVRSTNESTTPHPTPHPHPRRRMLAIVRAASIALMVLATGLAGVAPAHAESTDGAAANDIDDIGTAPTPDGESAIYDIGTAPLLPVDLPPQADLGLGVTASTPKPYVDHSFSWTVQVANGGSAAAVAVVVTDLVPDQVTVVGVSSTDFSCTAAGNAVTCVRDEFLPGASGQITIDVMVPNSMTPQVVTNGASITSASADASPANNSGTSSVETVVVEIAPPVAPAETAPASPVPVTTLAEVAPAGPTATTPAPVVTPAVTDTLPLTGTNLQPLWLIASEALLVGLGLLAVARRRPRVAA